MNRTIMLANDSSLAFVGRSIYATPFFWHIYLYIIAMTKTATFTLPFYFHLYKSKQPFIPFFMKLPQQMHE
jgi:hypothetical protein